VISGPRRRCAVGSRLTEPRDQLPGIDVEAAALRERRPPTAPAAERLGRRRDHLARVRVDLGVGRDDEERRVALADDRDHVRAAVGLEQRCGGLAEVVRVGVGDGTDRPSRARPLDGREVGESRGEEVAAGVSKRGRQPVSLVCETLDCRRERLEAAVGCCGGVAGRLVDRRGAVDGVRPNRELDPSHSLARVRPVEASPCS